MALAPEQTGIGIRRHFSTEGVDPYDEVTWETRDARITNYRDGTVAFEQRDVEFPVAWSQNATNIVAQKYFRGSLGSPERERSLRQVINRVVSTVTAWGRRDGYFVDAAEADAFRDELTTLILHQRAAFNSPVWFNIGVMGAPQQASACRGGGGGGRKGEMTERRWETTLDIRREGSTGNVGHLLHPRRRGHDAVDPQLVYRRGDHLPRWFRIRCEFVDDQVVIRAPQRGWHCLRSRELYARCRRVRRNN